MGHPLTLLLGAEGFGGVDGGRLASGDVAGGERYQNQDESDSGEGERVAGRDAVKLGGHEAGESGGESDAGGDSEEGHAQALAEDEAQDVRTLRAERHADADFAGALADQIRDDAVDPDAGEQERERGKGGEQDHGEAACGEGALEDAVHGLDGVNDLVGVELGDGAADGGHDGGGIVVGAEDHGGHVGWPALRSLMATSCPECAYGSGLSSTPLTTEKRAVLAPIPRASVRMAMIAKAGDLPSMRRAKRMS